MRLMVTGSPAIFAWVSPKYGSSRGLGREACDDLAGPQALHGEQAVVVGDVGDLDLEPPDEVLEVGQVGLGGREERTRRWRCRKRTPSSSTRPASSHQIVYWARPTRQVRTSRAITPPRKRSASRPRIQYLYIGEESKTATPLRIGDVLVLDRHLVLDGRGSRPSASRGRAVELSETRVEGRRHDHGRKETE